MDDILVFSTSLEEHISNLKRIFGTLKKSGLKLQIDKCNFLNKETEYLGHILTPQGVKPNPEKITVIQNLKLPTTQKQIKSFLGITGFYRKFIKDYAKIALPILKYSKKNTKVNAHDPNYIASFEKLKSLITDYPILKYPNFNRRFKLITDASNFALGAVLTQDGHPVCYASRTLNDHEKNYSTIEKELLAIVWGTKYFRPYLFGKEFDLQTDHQPIKWLQAKNIGQNISPRLQRWLMQLGEYDIKIDYIKGKENKVADFLSRINRDNNEINLFENLFNTNNEEHINSNESLEVLTVHSQEENNNDHIPILETVVNRFKTQIIILEQKEVETENIFNHKRIFIDKNDIPDQISDIVRRHITRGKIGIYCELSDSLYNIVQKKLIELRNPHIKFVKCSFLAKDLKDEKEALKQISLFHKVESGHSGMLVNYEGMKTKVYFPNLKILINKVINNCDICTAAKYDRNPIKNKFQSTETPDDINDIIHVDVYTNSKHNFINFIDKFSKHAISLPLEDRNHKTLIEKLRQFISIKGKMKKLVCDNEFNSINVKQFCRDEGIEIHFVKPNNHTGNSDVERLNGTLTERIRALNLENKIPINEQMFKAVEYYNNSYHSTIEAKPIEVQNRTIDTKIVKDRMDKRKSKVISKLNKNREDYHETRREGFIKNYVSLRHKEQPKFRKYPLKGVHESNIKRPLKFSGEDGFAIDVDVHNPHQPTNPDT